MRAALEAAGIEFPNDDQHGVRWPTIENQKVSVPISPYQMQEARLILGWSRQSLSNASDTTVGFVKGYEEFGRVSRLNLRRHNFDGLAAIRDALEQAGIEFTNGNVPGVRLAKPSAE